MTMQLGETKSFNTKRGRTITMQRDKTSGRTKIISNVKSK